MRHLRLAPLAFLGSLGLLACREAPTAPDGPPYLAIVAKLDAPPGVTVRGPFRYRIREYSGTLGIDRTVSVDPGDTVIVSVPPATYLVELAGVEPQCAPRDGFAQSIVVPPKTNTSLIRYAIACRAPLTVFVSSDGVAADSAFVVSVVGPGVTRALVADAADTLPIDPLPPGDYSVVLRHVAAHCTVTSDGGDRQFVRVPEQGGASAAFRVVCADPARRPRVLSLGATYVAGTVALAVRAVDPDRDLERYAWSVTDCHGRSTMGPWRMRRGLSTATPTAGRDTVTFVGAYELGLADTAFAGRCVALIVTDERSNASPVAQVPLSPSDPARRPALAVDGRLAGTTALRTTLTASDADGDLLGLYVVFETRDGALIRPFDGVPDRLIFDPAGLRPGDPVRDVPLGGAYGRWDDYYAVIAYAIDRAGNVTRVEDRVLNR